MSAKQLRRSMPLMDRFLLRELRLKQSIQSIGEGKVENLSNLQQSVVNPNAFKTYKNPYSQRWIPSRLSLRRQAQLGKHAFANGRFDELIFEVDRMNLGKKSLAGPKLNKMRERIEELRNEALKQHESISSSSETVEQVAAQIHVPEQTPDQVRKLAKALASTHGPYRGRSKNNIFKGTIQERQAPKKRQNILDRMEKMDDVVANWRKQRKDTKTKALPKLPF